MNNRENPLLMSLIQAALARAFADDQTPHSEYEDDFHKIFSTLGDIDPTKVRGVVTMVLLEDNPESLSVQLQTSVTPAVGKGLIDFYNASLVQKVAEECPCPKCRARRGEQPDMQDIDLGDALRAVFGEGIDIGGIQVFQISPKR